MLQVYSIAPQWQPPAKSTGGPGTRVRGGAAGRADAAGFADRAVFAGRGLPADLARAAFGLDFPFTVHL